MIRELQHLIDKKRMRTSVAQLELKIQANNNELEIANSMLLEREREVGRLNDLVERLQMDLGMREYQGSAQDMTGKSIAEIANISRDLGAAIDSELEQK